MERFIEAKVKRTKPPRLKVWLTGGSLIKGRDIMRICSIEVNQQIFHQYAVERNAGHAEKHKGCGKKRVGMQRKAEVIRKQRRQNRKSSQAAKDQRNP